MQAGGSGTAVCGYGRRPGAIAGRRWRGTGEGGIADSIRRPPSARGRRVETPQAVDSRSSRNSIAAVGFAACLILAGSLGRPGTGKTIAGGSALGECCGSRVMPAESALQEPFGAFF